MQMMDMLFKGLMGGQMGGGMPGMGGGMPGMGGGGNPLMNMLFSSMMGGMGGQRSGQGQGQGCWKDGQEMPHVAASGFLSMCLPIERKIES